MATLSRVARTEKATVVTRQVLTFLLSSEHFGIDIANIREVIEYGGVTEVPLMPKFVRGVINLRGEIVPILDLSARIGRKSCEIFRRSCIVIVHVQYLGDDHVIGLVVDAVNEVIDIPEQDIELAPSFGLKLRSEFVRGVAKQNDSFVILLNVEHVLSLDEMTALVAQESDIGLDAEHDKS